MWALGVILHELLTTELPFYSDNALEFKQNIVNQSLKLDDVELWQSVSEEAKDLVNKLLEKDPITRLSAQDALNHPWFDDLKPKRT